MIFAMYIFGENFRVRDMTTTQTNVNPPPPILIDNHTQQPKLQSYSHFQLPMWIVCSSYVAVVSSSYDDDLVWYISI